MTTPAMPLNCDGFFESLADYLEGDASDVSRAAVQAHAATCPGCRQLLADLDNVRVGAAALPTLAPSYDLWSGISERIGTRVIPMEAPHAPSDTAKHRMWFRPALAAAALVIVTAGVTSYLTRASVISPTVPDRSVAAVRTPVVPAGEATGEIISTATERPSAGTAAGAARLVSAAPATEAADPVFASEISKLRKIVRERHDQLDPRTVAVLQQSIAVIDSAIVQSRAALQKDPASGYLATQLNHSLEKKVELLRITASLPSRS